MRLGARRPYKRRYTGRGVQFDHHPIYYFDFASPLIPPHEDHIQLGTDLRDALGTVPSIPKLPEQPSPVVAAPSTAGARANSASFNRGVDTNRTQSDDPEEKMKGREEDIPFNGSSSTSVSATGGANTSVTSGRRSSPRAPGAGPLGGPVGSVDATDKDREGTLRLLRPADSITIAQEQNEFDVTDDNGRKRVFFTDGRKLNKSKDEKYQEMAAQWQGGRLVSDEKGPRNAKLSRTFEISRDSHQLYETILLDNSRIFSPLMIRYVYDPAPLPKQP